MRFGTLRVANRRVPAILSADGAAEMRQAARLCGEDLGDVDDLLCIVDGATMQDSNTELMIFSVAKLVAHCSAATTLDPGDVILTGTPAGVAMGRDPAPWLQPRQLCEIDIEGIGRLANRITAG